MNYFEDDDLNNKNDENQSTTPTPAPSSPASSQVLGNSSCCSTSHNVSLPAQTNNSEL